MIGEKFNDLKIIAFSHKDKKYRRYYLCECICGNRKIIHLDALKTGNTKSCGCLKTKTAKNRILPDNAGVKYQILLGYKRHAKDRNIEFCLSKEIFNKLIQEDCYYCGLPPSNLKKTKNCKEGFLYSGIDRIDSTLNYTEDNVVACCGTCNKVKMASRREEFLDWIERVYNYSIRDKK